ncbi:flagellar hook capping FlgD N-terminal domain-containing protein [Ruegeria sp.]|uniref:flagellar hook capping FlgD N-terminal domain-containing protein n=1 Tax=Ruegeria sp. TaxID=1879320 RepID=UPI003C7B8DDC
MMTSVNSTVPNAAPQSTGTSQSSALTSDFETFLRMLTAQARNQDPLEPLDSSEYASQLAQFSMVEQQVQTNDLLSSLAVALGSVNLDQLAGWVGMDVQATAAFRFDTQPVAISVHAEPTADKAIMVIRDAEGTVVDQIPVPVDENEFVWAGVDDAGDPMPAGSYSASLQSYNGDELLAENPAAVYSTVVAAQMEGGQIILTLDSGAEISADKVSGIRAGA